MGYDTEIRQLRAERDAFFAHHYASPLPEEDMESFVGLDYFPPDASWVVNADFVEDRETKVEVPSSIGTSHPYTRLGWAILVIGGTSYRLVVLDDGDGNPFIPFADETNGTETYSGGRYVPLSRHDDGHAHVDFNRAHNPYCVYDDEFVCPFPPPSNRIAVPIGAGEKLYRSPSAPA